MQISRWIMTNNTEIILLLLFPYMKVLRVRKVKINNIECFKLLSLFFFFFLSRICLNNIFVSKVIFYFFVLLLIIELLFNILPCLSFNRIKNLLLFKKIFIKKSSKFPSFPLCSPPPSPQQS